MSTITAGAYYDLTTMQADSIVYNYQCGDWHTINGNAQFFPYAVHNKAWFKTLMISPAPAGGGGRCPPSWSTTRLTERSTDVLSS